MTRARPKYTPTPRILDAYQVACRLNKGEGWFQQHREELYQQDFPKFDPLLCGWDGDAIDIWLDKRAGLADDLPQRDDWSEAIGNGAADEPTIR